MHNINIPGQPHATFDGFSHGKILGIGIGIQSTIVFYQFKTIFTETVYEIPC